MSEVHPNEAVPNEAPPAEPVPKEPAADEAVLNKELPGEAAAEETAEKAEPAEAKPERPAPDMIQKGLFFSQLSNLTKNTLPEGFPEDWTYGEALFAWAKKQIPDERADLFRSLFSTEQLQKSFSEGKTVCTFDYDDREDVKLSRRLTMHLMSDEDSGDVLSVASIKSFPRPEESAEVGPAAPFKAVIRSYDLFFSVDLNNPRIFSSSVFRDEDKVSASLTLPCMYKEFIKAVADKYVRAAWEEEFLGIADLAHLKEQAAGDQPMTSHTFSSDGGTRRIEIYLPDPKGEDQRCFIGLGAAAGGEENGLVVTSQDVLNMNNQMEDLRLEMQMEREETKKKNRRRTFLVTLLAILVSVVGGAVLAIHVPEVGDAVTRFFPLPVEEEPEVTPPPVVEVEVKEQEVVQLFVPMGQPADFDGEVQENGLPRSSDLSDNYETLTFSVSAEEVLEPEWFGQTYPEGYYLDGTEAAVHLKVAFTGGEEITSIIPQETLPMRVVDAAGNTVTGYQLMDQALGGSYNVSVAQLSVDEETGEVASDAEASDLYKRYIYSPDARYLVVTAYIDDVRYEYWFALRLDDANVDYDPVEQGMKGDLEKVINGKLFELGYLTNAQAAVSDQFGRDTTAAVKAAQEDFGMEATGVADTLFLKELFAREPAAEEEAETEDAAAETQATQN